MISLRLFIAALACVLLFGVESPAVAEIEGDAVFLVATRKMTDPRFVKTVVLVTRHGRSPPLGVIINRPLDIQIEEAIPSLLGRKLPPSPSNSQPVYFGGPVSPGMMVFLFRSGDPAPGDAITIAGDIYLGRAAETLDEILRGKRSTRGLKVFSGYSGWAEGQLENEIARGDWLVQSVDHDYLFDKDVEVIWSELYRRATQITAQAPRGLVAQSSLARLAPLDP